MPNSEWIGGWIVGVVSGFLGVVIGLTVMLYFSLAAVCVKSPISGKEKCVYYFKDNE